MPTYICQGRYSREAIQGMIKSPEDRTQVVTKLMKAVGGKLLSYYVTFGEYDWLLIAEAPDEQAISAAVLTAAAGGGVTDLRTIVAMTPAQAKGVHEGRRACRLIQVGWSGTLTRAYRGRWRFKRPLFVLLHHGREAHDIGGQDGGEAAGGHSGRPARRRPSR
jgi:uncharacterized protein with GYD domain